MRGNVTLICWKTIQETMVDIRNPPDEYRKSKGDYLKFCINHMRMGRMDLAVEYAEDLEAKGKIDCTHDFLDKARRAYHECPNWPGILEDKTSYQIRKEWKEQWDDAIRANWED